MFRRRASARYVPLRSTSASPRGCAMLRLPLTCTPDGRSSVPVRVPRFGPPRPIAKLLPNAADTHRQPFGVAPILDLVDPATALPSARSRERLQFNGMFLLPCPPFSSAISFCMTRRFFWFFVLTIAGSVPAPGRGADGGHHPPRGRSAGASRSGVYLDVNVALNAVFVRTRGGRCGRRFFRWLCADGAGGDAALLDLVRSARHGVFAADRRRRPPTPRRRRVAPPS